MGPKCLVWCKLQWLLVKDLQILPFKKVFSVKFNFEHSIDVCRNGKLGFSVTTSLSMTLPWWEKVFLCCIEKVKNNFKNLKLCSSSSPMNSHQSRPSRSLILEHSNCWFVWRNISSKKYYSLRMRNYMRHFLNQQCSSSTSFVHFRNQFFGFNIFN